MFKANGKMNYEIFQLTGNIVGKNKYIQCYIFKRLLNLIINYYTESLQQKVGKRYGTCQTQIPAKHVTK